MNENYLSRLKAMLEQANLNLENQEYSELDENPKKEKNISLIKGAISEIEQKIEDAQNGNNISRIGEVEMAKDIIKEEVVVETPKAKKTTKTVEAKIDTKDIKKETIKPVKKSKEDTDAFDVMGDREFIVIEDETKYEEGIKGLKQKEKRRKQLTSKYSKDILDGAIITTQNFKPEVSKHVYELKNVRKSYITGDLETPVLKGIDIQLDQGDFIVILGPSGSGKTTFLNIISGLDKASEGDVFVLGSNLTLLKDSHLTKFRRRNVGFIFQQYNLLTNLTAKENAEVGENLSSNKSGMDIDTIFDTIGMKEQMHKYPHQMSGGQQQRVSIARALAKNPNILFADEPTGALDEEMGRKVLEILVKVNREYKTTVVVVTHNPNIATIANTVIHIKNGLIDKLEHNKKPADPSTIDWS